MAQAEQAYETAIGGYNALYSSSLQQAQATRISYEEQANSTYESAAQAAQSTYQGAATAAGQTYTQAQQSALSAYDQSAASASSSYQAALQSATSSYAGSVQAANLAYDTSAQQAQNAYQQNAQQALATQNAGLVSAQQGYEQTMATADQTLASAQQLAQQQANSAAATALGTFDSNMGSLRTTHLAADQTASQTANAALATSWLTEEQAAWSAQQTRAATLKQDLQAQQTTQQNAENTYNSAVRPVLTSQLTQQKNAQFTRLSAYATAATTYLQAKDAYSRALLLARVTGDTNAASAALAQAQQQYQLAIDQADLAYKQSMQQIMLSVTAQQQQPVVQKVQTLEQAQATLALQVAQANQAFISTMAPTVATANIAQATDQAALAQATASALAAQSESVSQGVLTYQNALTAAQDTLSHANAAALAAWQTTEAGASQSQAQTQAAVSQQASDSLAAAGQTANNALATAYSTWNGAIDSASTTLTQAQNQAQTTLTQAQSSAATTYQQALNQAASQQNTALQQAQNTQGQSLAQAWSTWLSSEAAAQQQQAVGDGMAVGAWLYSIAQTQATAQASIATTAQQQTDAWAQQQGTHYAAEQDSIAKAWTQRVRSVSAAQQQQLQQAQTTAQQPWWLAFQSAGNSAISQEGQAALTLQEQVLGGLGSESQSLVSALSAQAVADLAAANVYAQAQASAASSQAQQTTQLDNTLADAQAQAALTWTSTQEQAALTQAQADDQAFATQALTDAATTQTLSLAGAQAQQTQSSSLADAQQTHDNAANSAESTREVTGWQDWSAYSQLQASTDQTQALNTQQASQTYKLAIGAADVAFATAAGLAQYNRRQLEANAQASLVTGQMAQNQASMVAQAQQTLSTDQAKPSTSFSNVTVQTAPTIFQQAQQAYSSGGWAGLINFALDLTTNGDFGKVMTSPQFTKALNATDGFFAGWADKLTFGGSTKLRTLMYGDLAAQNHQGQYFELGQMVGDVHLSLISSAANPCAMSSAGKWIYRGYEAAQGLRNGYSSYNNYQQGNYVAAAMDAISALGNFASAFKACFAAGTPVLTWDGHKLIEDIKPGDLVLSRDENDPSGAVEVKVVEEVFVRLGLVLQLRVGGHVIRTTAEHPFYVEDKGWVPALELRAGDLLSSHDGKCIAVEAVAEMGDVTTVYNFRVADFHTYFVGSLKWGFSVWAHNAGRGYSGTSKAKQTSLHEEHFVEWELKGPRGGKLAADSEISGVDFALKRGERLTFPEQSWYGHTEGKVISELMDAGKLAPGRSLWFTGELPPCTSCQNIMKWASGQFKMQIFYQDGLRNFWAWKNGLLVAKP